MVGACSKNGKRNANRSLVGKPKSHYRDQDLEVDNIKIDLGQMGWY